jgi:hypothetical protein
MMRKMLTLTDIINWYNNINREITSLYQFVEIIANEYQVHELLIPIAAQNGYKVTAKQINHNIDDFNKEIAAATSGRTNAVLYGPMLYERGEFMEWLNDVYNVSPLIHVPETGPF